MVSFACKMLVISAILMSIKNDAVMGQKYSYIESIGGWLKKHKLAATWHQAYDKCRQEGAVLAVPSTEEIILAMRYMSKPDKPMEHFIGMRDRYARGIYVTDEGISLYDMPAINMVESLNPRDGNCLSMNVYQIQVADCNKERPFICYRKKTENDTMTECGTYDKQYKLNAITGSCYKYHTQKSAWDQAYERCINEGGYLVAINDITEATAIDSMFHIERAYIGLQALDGGRVWQSTNGDPLNTLYNDPGTFNDHITYSEYSCAIISNSTDILSNEPNCDAKENFICERDPRNERRFSFGEL